MKFLSSVLLTFALLLPAHAYEYEYQVDGSFIIQATSNSKTWFEIWEVNAGKSTLYGKPYFTEIDLIIVPLYPYNECYVMGDMTTESVRHTKTDDYEETTPFSRIYESNGVIYAETGTGSKLNLKIEFNDDGSLKDIQGSKTNPINPENITVYKLLKTKKDICINLPYKFDKWNYSYHRRDN